MAQVMQNTPSTPLQVEKGQTVGITFSLHFHQGELIEQTEPGDVFEFEVGDGTLFPTLEQWLVGLELGTGAQMTLSPEQAFGEPDPQNKQTMAMSDFPESMALTPGLVVGMTLPTGDEIPAKIEAVNTDDETVAVDFNHPLCGHTLDFDFRIMMIQGVYFEPTHG